MRTPAGAECRYYYEDFNRGRRRQECRLLARGAGWKPGDCARCAVPRILWANASEHLELFARLDKGFLGLGRQINVTARCRKHACLIDDPYAGCAQCAEERPGLADFLESETL